MRYRLANEYCSLNPLPLRILLGVPSGLGVGLLDRAAGGGGGLFFSGTGLQLRLFERLLLRLGFGLFVGLLLILLLGLLLWLLFGLILRLLDLLLPRPPKGVMLFF